MRDWCIETGDEAGRALPKHSPDGGEVRASFFASSGPRWNPRQTSKSRLTGGFFNGGLYKPWRLA